MTNIERASVVLLVCAAAACSKPDAAKPDLADASPPAANTFRITATTPTEPVPTGSGPTAADVAPVPTGIPSVTATTTAKAPAAKATTLAVAANSAPAAPEPPPLKGASTHLSGKNFTLDVSSPGCRVDTPCAVSLRVAAVGDFHVNKEYPYKFTATPAAGVAFLGNGDPNTFSRASGDFREDGEKTGTMTVRLKPSAAGTANVTGTYKMSVCSAEQCQIESQAVSLAVPVL